MRPLLPCGIGYALNAFEEGTVEGRMREWATVALAKVLDGRPGGRP